MKLVWRDPSHPFNETQWSMRGGLEPQHAYQLSHDDAESLPADQKRTGELQPQGDRSTVSKAAMVDLRARRSL